MMILFGCVVLLLLVILAALNILQPSQAILSGVPQFIVTSINFLITTGQSRYLIDVECAARQAIDGYEDIREDAARRVAYPKLQRFEINWQIFLCAWWYLTLASLIGIFRIVLSAGYNNDKTMPLFIRADILIVSLMLLGYGFLAMMTFRAWHLKEARGKKFPGKPVP